MRDSESIIIIDIETTGFLNAGGKICEIGIVELCFHCGTRKIVFDQVINPEGVDDEHIRKSWISYNNYMTVEEIREGCDFNDIKQELQDLVSSYPAGATAYNRNFDFDFLEFYGIFFPEKLICPMLEATPICKIPNKFGRDKWPKVEEAYKHFFPEEEYTELHRGADDAMHEAKIVHALYKLDKDRWIKKDG